MAGTVYGGTADRRSKAYVEYLDSKLNFVKSRLANLPANQRPTVVHIASADVVTSERLSELYGVPIHVAGVALPGEAGREVHTCVAIPACTA